MVFNTTINNVSAISWRSVLLVEETGEPRENHRPVAVSLTNYITKCCIDFTGSWNTKYHYDHHHDAPSLFWKKI